MSPVVQPTSETSLTLANYPPPIWLKHTPMYLLPYEHFDGPYAGNTDAKYLGFGRAQWRNDDDPNALSVKSWRKPDERWSRQSEEIPLHRNVDMTMLLAHIIASDEAETVKLPSGTFESQNDEITLRRLTDLPAGCTEELQRCRARLHELRNVLNRLNI